MRFAAMLALLFVSFAAPIGAEEPVRHWEFAGWEGGGCYPALEIDHANPGRVYLGSDVAGLWRSDDYGDNWSFQTRGLGNLNVAVIAVAPSNSSTVYAGTKGGLYVSKDAGLSWQAADSLGGKIRFSRPASYRSIAVSRANADHVCVGSSKGIVACSEDAGASWRVLGPDYGPFDETTTITSLAVSPDESVLWAGSKKGLARYSFADDRWSILADAPKPVSDFVVVGTEKPTLIAAGQPSLWFSEDGGASWWPSAQVPNGDTSRIAARRDENGLFLSIIWNKGWEGGVLTSSDRGVTWQSANKFMQPDTVRNPTRAWHQTSGRVAALKLAKNPLIMLRSDWWGVFRSDDGGITWKERIKGAPNTVGSDIAVSPTGRIYVATMDDGLVSSSDGGVTYQPLFPTEGYSEDKNGHVWRVALTGKGAGTVIATSSPWGKNLNQVIVSQDGGANFKMARMGLPASRPKVNTVWGEGYPRALAVDPYEPKRVYVGIDGDDGGGLYISDDGGINWQEVVTQPPSKRIYNALAIDPTETTRILWGATGEKGGIYLSRNGGKSWENVLPDFQWVFDAAIAKDGTQYAAGDKDGPVLYVSHQQGAKWKLLKHFPGKGVCEAVTPDPYKAGRVAVSTVHWGDQSGGRIFFSDDNGEFWKDITGDLPEGAGAAAMAFGPDKYLYISRMAGSVYRTKLE